MSGGFHRIDLQRKQIIPIIGEQVGISASLQRGDYSDLMNPPEEVEYAVFSPEPNDDWVLDTDTLDIALAWQLSGVEVILDIRFKYRDSIPLDQLLAICSGSGFAVSLALPVVVDQETAEQWIEWCIRATSATVIASQPCFVYPVSQYIEWMMLDEIEPQEVNVVTLPTHAYGKWVADAVTERGLVQRLKRSIAAEMDYLLGDGWAQAINHQIAQTVFHQPPHDQ
ncbi:MAG: hypothetical protein JAZ11_02670 [Candidatus Thiodiazotropha lotti]|nr:hypothetical protein [Candidatus Thiodiazotropha lotti]